MLHKHHSICSSQIQTQPTHMGSEQQNIYGWVIIEPVEEKKKKKENPYGDPNWYAHEMK